MALFALWRNDGIAVGAAHAQLAGEAHVAAPHTVSHTFQTPSGCWHLAAFATRTAFYAPEDQIWVGRGEACVIHGLVWREAAGAARLLDATAVAELLDRPGATLPADCAGEYAIARLHRDGTVEAFGDAAGLHHIFRSCDGLPIIANRAGFIATLRGDWTADVEGLLWLPTIGYRVGERSAYRVARALRQAQRLQSDGRDIAEEALPGAAVDLAGSRGFDHAGELFEQGLIQAQAAIRLATDGQDRIALPITGGKDSRVILALCLAAGLRDRLSLFTRGYEGHPDVLAGRGIAEALGLPHGRIAPHGSDLPAHWSLDRFVSSLAAQAYQSDGMMGGWDYIVGEALHDEVLITGHMGEVLKAYSKRSFPEGGLDPVSMVRLQAPFDPLDLLRAPARTGLIDQVAGQMAANRAGGAEEGDLPDLFYFQNRVPGWLGGIRGIKSFERQPVMPLGVPALMRLAFRLTPAERKRELVHHRIIATIAPELLAPAFALQSWDASLDVAGAAPILPGAGAPPVFGNWQYSLNSNPAIRAWLAERVAGYSHPLWDAVDRDRVLDVLRGQRIDYFQGISLLGLVVALFGPAGIIRPLKIGEQANQMSIRLRVPETGAGLAWTPAGASPAAAEGARPLAYAARALLNGTAPRVSVERCGHLDNVTGAVERIDDGDWRVTGEGTIAFVGWLLAPDQPAAQAAVTLVVDERTVALAIADRPRGDLARLGYGDGAHGFSIEVETAALREIAGTRDALDLRVTAFDSDFVPHGGALRLRL